MPTHSKDQARVLVVDDDPAIRALVVRALERSGFVVEPARDGLEAVEKLGLEHFDLLVLDLMMPRLDGFGVVERLYSERDGESNGLPKIMIMSAASPSVLNKVPIERVAKIILKPFDLETLIASARGLVGGD